MDGTQSPLQISPCLILDTMEVDTSKAEQYFKENSPFRSHGAILKEFTGTKHTAEDSYGNIIVGLRSLDFRAGREPKPSTPWLPISEEMSIKIITVAKKIEENIEVLSQIEYLVRKTPIECNKKQLQLVVQHYFNVASGDMIFYSGSWLEVYHKPLLFLGLIANSLAQHDEIIISSSEDSFAVLNLITQLCAEAGFNICLILHDVDSKRIVAYDNGENFCIGIVTEKCDVDSAIDTFIESSIHAPWKLHRIYVQECIYEQFRDALKSKSSLRPVDCTATKEFEATSKDVVPFEDKVFLLDYAGNEIHSYLNKNVILIEAYRTTKEVLSLMKLHNHMYMSLWSSDISEAYEIAFGSDTPVVWINDYAIFDGPAKAAEAIYSSLQWQYFRIHLCRIDVDMIEGFNKLFMAIRKALEKVKVKVEDKTNILKTILNPDFVEISKGRMCVGTCHPKALVINVNDWVGNLGCFYIQNNDFNALLSIINSLGLKMPTELNCPVTYLVVFTQVKTVWSNFGTIFAN